MTDPTPQGRPRAPKLALGVPKPSVVNQPLSELRRSLEPMFEPIGLRLPALLSPIDDDERCPQTVRAPVSPHPSELAVSHAIVAVDDRSTVVLSVRGSASRAERRAVACGRDDSGGELGEAHAQPASTRLEEEFFRFDSFPPVVGPPDEAELAVPAVEPPSPAVLARRRRLRTGVGATLALTAALTVAALVYGSLGPGRGLRAAHAEPARGQAAGATIQQPERRAAERITPSVAVATPSAVSGEPVASIDEGAGDLGAASDSPAALGRAAVELLIRREPARAAELARALIAAEPEGAFGYLCLGSALQDQGKWVEAHQAYTDCARHAKRGDVGECGALGGRR
jgi:hypothetical protein